MVSGQVVYGNRCERPARVDGETPERTPPLQSDESGTAGKPLAIL